MSDPHVIHGMNRPCFGGDGVSGPASEHADLKGSIERISCFMDPDMSSEDVRTPRSGP